MIRNIPSNSTELEIIESLISVEITDDTQSLRAVILFYLLLSNSQFNQNRKPKSGSTNWRKYRN
ncbi:hypothetical protein Hanom_Chr00s000901g01669601 [Helianthus anomalus]